MTCQYREFLEWHQPLKGRASRNLGTAGPQKTWAPTVLLLICWVSSGQSLNLGLIGGLGTGLVNS